MGEHRIIKPNFKPVKRITVDVDESGEVQVNGQRRGPLGQTQPLSMFDVCVVLSSVLASSLLAIAGSVPLTTKKPTIKPHEFVQGEHGHGTYCKLCGESDRAACHTKGKDNGESETEN